MRCARPYSPLTVHVTACRWALTAVVLTAVPATTNAQVPGGPVLPSGPVAACPQTQGPTVTVSGDRLVAAMALLRASSPTFNRAMDRIEARGRVSVRVGYPDHLDSSYQAAYRRDEVVAAIYATGADGWTVPGTVVCGIDVVLFTESVESAALLRGETESRIVLDLALVLAHELVGHVVPFVDRRTHTWPTPCRDADLPAGTGCAVERENRVRAELGVARRRSYGSTGLRVLCPAHDCGTP